MFVVKFNTPLDPLSTSPVVTSTKGSLQADIKAERVGVVWAEFVTTSIDFHSHIYSEGRGGHSAKGAWGEH